jgi:hypothetical protein
MSNVYDQHQQHTRRTGAYAILHNGEHVANITIAFPADGAGRLYAYAHWIGTQMIRGSANGYGYDKRSAAVASAATKYLESWHKVANDGTVDLANAFWNTISVDRGQEWHNRLRDAGFTVCQVC